jgi:hypothetical protein
MNVGRSPLNHDRFLLGTNAQLQAAGPEGTSGGRRLALPVFYESFSLDHLMPVYKPFYADLGAGRRVIRFDWRGIGLSARAN